MQCPLFHCQCQHKATHEKIYNRTGVMRSGSLHIADSQQGKTYHRQQGCERDRHSLTDPPHQYPGCQCQYAPGFRTEFSGYWQQQHDTKKCGPENKSCFFHSYLMMKAKATRIIIYALRQPIIFFWSMSRITHIASANTLLLRRFCGKLAPEGPILNEPCAHSA